MPDTEAVIRKDSRIKYGTVVAICVGKCRPHEFQDKQYRGMRLHNICGKGTKRRCTVCSHDTGL